MQDTTENQQYSTEWSSWLNNYSIPLKPTSKGFTGVYISYIRIDN